MQTTNNFVMEDGCAYVALYIGICYRVWHLRVASLKLMAPVFQAFDRPTYQQLIPQHLKDLACMPRPILEHLDAGGFSVHLTPSQWHAVALHECHEMKINKDAKLAIIHPNPQCIKHLSNYLPFRSACINNLSAQLFPERYRQSATFLHQATSKDKTAEKNVQQMFDCIEQHGMFHNNKTN